MEFTRSSGRLRSWSPRTAWARGVAAFLIALTAVLWALATPATAQTGMTLRASTLYPAEGETVTLTVTLSRPATSAVSNLTVGLGGTARSGVDFDLLGIPSIPAGGRTATFQIAILTDAVDDPGETITVGVDQAVDRHSSRTVAASNRITLTIGGSGTTPISPQPTAPTPRQPRTPTSSQPTAPTSSRPPAPTATPTPIATLTPTPTPMPRVIGSTACAEAVLQPSGRLLIRRFDRPDASLELAVGRFRYMGRHEDLPAPAVARLSREMADGSYITRGGFIRETLGQTYLVVRRDMDGRVVRRWVPPDSPLVYEIPWSIVNTRFTVPPCVAAAIPLDEQFPAPRQMARRFEGDDVRIFGFDPALARWRWVPDIESFQAWGFYWCDVTVADPTFFERLPGGTLGPPYPASEAPGRDDYPTCHTITPSTPASHGAQR